MIKISASDFYTLLSPSKCELRCYLKNIGKKEAPPGPYTEILFRLGKIHEKSHLDTFPEYVDFSKGSLEEREKKTVEAIKQSVPIIYQAVLKTTLKYNDRNYEILGEPDFLIKNENGYIIRDSKISRRIKDKEHPEIFRQLEVYGWLYERCIGKTPISIQVHSGTGEIIDIPNEGIVKAQQNIEYLADLMEMKSEPYSPVGWSKCGGCPFHDHCWPRAEAQRDVALIPDIDQNLAVALRENGINTFDDLLKKFDENSLSQFSRPWGSRMQKVGIKANSIILMARAISENKEIMIQPPQIPDYSNYVMFDLEGLPPQMDEIEKIYLWGLQVFGKDPGDFLPAVAGFGKKGDKEGWENFLKNSEIIFKKYGDIPFVHWHSYEKVKIDLYIERYGDSNEIAKRVKSNLLDLFPKTKESIVLPLPSYSLKVVEKYVGYKRTLKEVAGDWAIAKYIEATEMEDKDERNKVMNEILLYNREDLEATWAVLKWLKSKI
jgi:predicted RecB family nuclease